MKAIANISELTTSPVVELSHNDKKVSYSISTFGKSNFSGSRADQASAIDPTNSDHISNEFDVFKEINEYWAQLPSQAQDRIFQIYEEIMIQFDSSVIDSSSMKEYIADRINELVQIHDLDKMYDWVYFKSNIIIPDTFNENYNHSIDNNTSREKTYTRKDYIQLVTLSLMFRTLIPIWGEYINQTRRDSGNLRKEFYAFQLVYKSPIIHYVAMEKLRVYIEHIVGDDKNKLNTALKGIASEDYCYWLTTLVCVKRICIGDIRGVNRMSDLIKLMYKFVIQKINGTESNFEDVIKPKTFDDKNMVGEENKTSTLERYKIKSNLSLGEIVELEYSIKDIKLVAKNLSPNIDEDFLDKCIESAQHLLNQRILDPQMTLLKWVFKPVISPKGLQYVGKQTTVNALGALQAVLWTRGHHYLSVLATSYAITSDSGIYVSPIDSRIRVPEELNQKMNEIYPFARLSNPKKPTSRVNLKDVNLASQAISDLVDTLAMHSWRPTANDDILLQVTGSTSRRLPIKPDILIDLTKLVIEIGSRSWI